jgi:hypothetical protein
VKKAYNSLVGELDGRDHLKEEKVDGSTVLKLTSNEWDRNK